LNKIDVIYLCVNFAVLVFVSVNLIQGIFPRPVENMKSRD
jgi:hypothetical protein